ncbi:MAG: DUF2279 domain-containing protein [Bacteroidales bacterium]
MDKSISILILLALLNGYPGPVHAAKTDSTSQNRLRNLLIAKGSLYAGSLIGLNALWYSNYERSSFHFNNEIDHWLQMDKAGHIKSSYSLSRLSSDLFFWSGIPSKNSAIWGSISGFTYLTVIEILDGFSAGWGASCGDLTANAFGAGLFLAQELAWKEQKLQIKYSFHRSALADKRPELLGENLPVQMLKDYNGMTLWLTATPAMFFKESSMPLWINLAFGYSATGMTAAKKNPAEWQHIPRYRQYLISLDINWKNIPTNSKTMKFIFNTLEFIKIPFPAVEFSQHGTKIHPLYF